MKIKFAHLLKENYYKTLATVFLAVGFSFSSYIGWYVKDIIFVHSSSASLLQCLICLGLGIMFLATAVFLGFKIDVAKGERKNEFRF